MSLGGNISGPVNQAKEKDHREAQVVHPHDWRDFQVICPNRPKKNCILVDQKTDPNVCLLGDIMCKNVFDCVSPLKINDWFEVFNTTNKKSLNKEMYSPLLHGLKKKKNCWKFEYLTTSLGRIFGQQWVLNFNGYSLTAQLLYAPLCIVSVTRMSTRPL